MGILLPSNPCLRSYGFESSPGCIQGKGRGNCPLGNQTRAKACSGQAVRDGSDTATHQALAALRHWPLRMARSPVRITSWSSAIRMRVMSFPHTLNSSRNHQAPDLGKLRNRLRRYLSCPARQGRVARSLSDPCGVRLPDDQGSTAPKVSSGTKFRIPVVIQTLARCCVRQRANALCSENSSNARSHRDEQPRSGQAFRNLPTEGIITLAPVFRGRRASLNIGAF